MNFCILDCSLSCLNPEMGLYHSTTFGRYVICCCWLPHHYEDMSKAEHLLMSSYVHYVHVLTSELLWCNQALTRYLTDAMRESRVLEFLHAVRIHHYAPKQRIILWCSSYPSVGISIGNFHMIIFNCNIETMPYAQFWADAVMFQTCCLNPLF